MRLVVFDLDGTITYRDTLWPYAQGFLRRSGRSRWRLPRAVPVLAAFALGCADHGAVKAAFIRAALGGATRAEIADWTARFVPYVLEHGCFAPALAAIANHRARGDVLVLMSASTDLYVPEISRRLGFNETVCTGVRWNADRLDGSLVTANCRGEEKARRFEQIRARHPGLRTVAYGNTGSDLAHMRMADEAWLVNGSGKAQRQAQRLGIATGRW